MQDYKMVPVEPTEEMLEAGHYAMVAGCYPSGVYADMIDAAPVMQVEPVAWQYRIKTTTTGSKWSAWVECSREEYEYASENPGPCERGITREGRKLYAAPVVWGEHYDQAPDWSTAPEGATHWGPETENYFASWYRQKDGVWECWLYPNDTSWSYASVSLYTVIIPRPETTWIPTNGEKPDLPDNMRVDVMYRDGDTDIGLVKEWRWAWIGRLGDITHYRVLQPASVVQEDNLLDIRSHGDE